MIRNANKQENTTYNEKNQIKQTQAYPDVKTNRGEYFKMSLSLHICIEILDGDIEDINDANETFRGENYNIWDICWVGLTAD